MDQAKRAQATVAEASHEVCVHANCEAAQLCESRCLAHVSNEQLQGAVDCWGGGNTFDATGARISEERLRELLEIVNADRQALLAQIDPDRPGGSFCGEMRFKEAEFTGNANFSGEVFFGIASFDRAVFQGNANFSDVHFTQHADFDGASFNGSADFRGVIFDDHVGFEDARFRSAATFAASKFRSTVDFENAAFFETTSFDGCTFQLARQFGPLVVASDIGFNECLFSQRITIEAVADSLTARAAIFSEGARLSLRKATVELDYSDFGRSSTLSHATTWTVPKKDKWSYQLKATASGQPRLLTLRGAQVAELSISDIDLCGCRFYRAHGLESLIVEPSCRWAQTPRLSHYTKRDVLAEESVWRDRQRKAWGLGSMRWSNRGDPRPRDDSDDHRLGPEQLAALYRALRKAREDGKDQAGAGDLYYGEMEMRRRAAMPKGRGRIRAFCDRSIITAYWLLSGYGLKASRAFIAWIALTIAAAFAFQRWGISPAPKFPRSALFAIESTSSLVRPAHLPKGYELSEVGEAIQLTLRLTGPVLIGLFLLALRARVKR